MKQFREQAHVFSKSSVIIETISEQITSAGEKDLLHLLKEQMMITWIAFSIKCSPKRWVQADYISNQKLSRQYLQL